MKVNFICFCITIDKEKHGELYTFSNILGFLLCCVASKQCASWLLQTRFLRVRMFGSLSSVYISDRLLRCCVILVFFVDCENEQKNDMIKVACCQYTYQHETKVAKL